VFISNIDVINEYSEYHKKRFDYLLKTVTEYTSKEAKVLEIGRGPFTKILQKQFSHLTTLGLPLKRSKIVDQDQQDQNDISIPHIEFDLNKAHYEQEWVALPQFDVIIFAEVLEHLYISVRKVLSFLRTGLTEKGIIICQTPNGVALHSRVKMLMGIVPIDAYDNEDLLEPGHYREYTKKELITMGDKSSLQVIKHEFQNYFGYQNPIIGIFDLISILIPSFKRGQTIIYQK